nr:hypothetical protein [Streptococcus suis]
MGLKKQRFGARDIYGTD